MRRREKGLIDVLGVVRQKALSENMDYTFAEDALERSMTYWDSINQVYIGGDVG